MTQKYPLIAGDVAFVKATDEAVFVVEIPQDDSGEVLVRRAVQTAAEGVQYVSDTFSYGELQTDKQRLLKEMDFIRFSADTRDKASSEYEAAKKLGKAAIAVPQADGNSGGSYQN